MKCAAHPKIETNLRCGKCGKPICPKCMVQTPVGARCRECSGLQKLPTFSVSAGYYLRAIGTGLGIAIVCGLLWGLVRLIVPYLYLNLILAMGAGFAIGEVVSLSVNRKRGIGLAAIAGTTVIASYAVSFLLLPFPSPGLGLILDLLSLVLGILVAGNRLY